MKYVMSIAGVCSALIPPFAYANTFIDDSKVSLTSRNYFLDRDYQAESVYPAARDWAQGFIFKAESGYTEGLVGVGLDVQAFAGFKLIGDNDYAGTGLLPVDKASNERANSYGEIGVTGKVKINNNTLHVGTLGPQFPVLMSSPARLFPQTYRGVHLQSTEIKDLKLHAIYVDRVNHRDSTNYEHLRLANPNQRFQSAAESSGLYMFGGEYKLNKGVDLNIYHAELHDIYQQSFFGVKTKIPTSLGNFVSDTRLFLSQDQGQARAGHIDNQHFGGIWGLNRNNHTMSVGYMKSFGDTALPTLSGGESPVFLDSMSADFSNKDEQVFHVRYDYDFKDTALNGLKFMTRYSKGVDIDLPKASDKDYEEHALDFDVSYRIPEGKLKGLNLRTRYSRYRNNMPANMTFRSDNELRVNVDYTWTFK